MEVAAASVPLTALAAGRFPATATWHWDLAILARAPTGWRPRCAADGRVSYDSERRRPSGGRFSNL